MLPVDLTGYKKPVAVAAGDAPILQWLAISDLVIDASFRRLIDGVAKRKLERIARCFSWSCFGTVIVTPTGDGKFTIIDGQLRTTAAALLGLEKVPCQVVSATREEQAIAYKVINGACKAKSQLAQHAASIAAGEPWSVRLADACAVAGVELLRYPVPVDRQVAGQTMAVGAISRCLARYGDDTLITALQCVTHTKNNRPGALSAKIIKVLCALLASDPTLRDSGLALFELFDQIDLLALVSATAAEMSSKRMNPNQALLARLRQEISKLSAS